MEAARSELARHGQQHVLRFLGGLPEEQVRALTAQLEEIDLDEVDRMAKSACAPEQAEQKITPFDRITDLASAAPGDAQRWYAMGMRAIADGGVAVLVLGGGQGTRLGSDKPKGMFDIGLPSHKTLFQIQAEKLQKLKELAAAHANKAPSQVSLPYYVMTSPMTHEETVEYLRANNYFGISANDIRFFQQGTLPCLSTDGKIILESASKVAEAPNGNGGVYEALAKHGILDDMERRGVKYVHVYCVDNVLVKVGDPTFIGFCLEKKADCGNKVVRKTDPHEKVGVMCLRDGKPGVIEYSELSKEMAEMKSSHDGSQLAYGAANIAIHFFTVEFLRYVSRQHLPYHVAHKKIPCADEQGRTITPHSNNGIKMERFVFDVFPMARNIVCFQVNREGEFAALKNASGPDSADTARAALSDYHKSLICLAGGTVKGDDLLEISSLLSYDGEGLSGRFKGQTIQTPAELH